MAPIERADSLRDAEAAVALGWPTFFVGLDKRPFRGTHGHLDATTDIAELRARHATLRLTSRAAIALGPDELVVDVDPRNGGDSSDVGLGDVEPTQRTMSGGVHFFFKNNGLRLRNGALPGLDLKTEGGYVAVYQSERLPRRSELLAVPQVTLDVLTSAMGASRTTAVEDEIAQWGEGERDTRLFSYLCRLRNAGMDSEGLKSEAIRKNVASCVPPLSDSQAVAKAEQASRYPIGEAYPVFMVRRVKSPLSGWGIR